jgi:hypothetical protein
MDVDQQRLEIGEYEMDDRQEILGHFRIATFGNSVVVVGALAQSGVAAPIVRDSKVALDNSTERLGTAIGHADHRCGLDRAAPCQRAACGEYRRPSRSATARVAAETARRIFSVSGWRPDRPPRTRYSMAAHHDGAHQKTSLAMTCSALQNARPGSNAKRLRHDATVWADEAVNPAGAFQISCASRVIASCRFCSSIARKPAHSSTGRCLHKPDRQGSI